MLQNCVFEVCVDRDTAPASDSALLCQRCRHYYITWDASFPYGCRAMHFKSRLLPSQEVLSASGHACLKFQPKSPRLSAQDDT